VTDFRNKLSSALQVEVPYTERPALKPGLKKAAVLALFGVSGQEPKVLVTKRTEVVETHKGQMAFPGGICEGDETDENAALRESEEEVGIASSEIEILGRLEEFATPTGFRICPVIGVLHQSIEKIQLQLNPDEIADALWISLSELKKVYRRELFSVGAVKYPIHVFQIGEHRIWGATGLMIKNLLDRLDRLG
jgi:8-oxo-dGTP pyrophosphatase MutT (NUDIX family)